MVNKGENMAHADLKTVELKVFFDESGKRKDKPNLMGGMVIPAKIYSNPKFELYSQKLRDKTLKLHFNAYTGHGPLREDMLEVLTFLSEYAQMIKFNVINYDYTTLIQRDEFSDEMIQKMIYTKFPERIIYGLLRGYGRNVYIETDIYIEDASEYTKFQLQDLVKEQLNTQSLYRSEQYIVTGSQLVPKGEEIGVELTDLLLGVIRNIILNTPDEKSKGIKAKNVLVIELLKKEKFLSLLSNIKYYEWTNNKQLTEVSFNDYIQLFLASHHEKWIV